MKQTKIRAVFMRGGTSKAVMFRRSDLPPDRTLWDRIFLKVMGSPDPNGRQLDGVGGGISSLSKVCVIGPPSRPDADVDFTFVQVSVDAPRVDYSGNCGNMSSAVGPFAVDEGLVAAPRDGEALVRIFNTNTDKLIHSHFRVAGGVAEVEGDLAIDGVAGTGAPVRLEFLEPGGTKTGRLLPTGSPVDELQIPGLGAVPASLVDAANPCVFVDAQSVGKRGDEAPEALEGDGAFMSAMEAIRRAAAVAMGLAGSPDDAAQTPSIPKVAIVAAPRAVATLSGRVIGAEEHDIGIRMISMERPHRAVPVTGAVCLGVASRVPGTLPNRLARAGEGPVRVAHPSGITVVDASIAPAGDGSVFAEHGAVYRTARRLFEGHVLHVPAA